MKIENILSEATKHRLPLYIIRSMPTTADYDPLLFRCLTEAGYGGWLDASYAMLPEPEWGGALWRFLDPSDKMKNLLGTDQIRFSAAIYPFSL